MSKPIQTSKPPIEGFLYLGENIEYEDDEGILETTALPIREGKIYVTGGVPAAAPHEVIERVLPPIQITPPEKIQIAPTHTITIMQEPETNNVKAPTEQDFINFDHTHKR